MAAILGFVKKSNLDTVKLLRWMLTEAEQGRVFDVRVGWHDQSGKEYLSFTGRYEDESRVIHAALRTIDVLMHKGKTP